MAADWNGDGKLDLISQLYIPDGYTELILLFPGNGDGTLAAPSGLLALTYSSDSPIAVGDFDRDGKLDLAFNGVVDPYFGSNGIVVLGKGGYTTFVSYEGPFPSGDFNNDGILDVVGGGGIILGNGDGTFTTELPLPSGCNANLAGDFNGDGNLDLAGQGCVLLGNGDGIFTLKDSLGGQGEIAADLNGDGKLDLVHVDTSSNSILIYLGNGDGTFQTPLEVPVGNSPTQAAIGDFNGDGRLDIAVTNSLDNTVSVLIQSPAAIVSLSEVSFGKEGVGTTSSPRSVYLKNSGSATLQLSNFVASGDFAETNDCKPTLYTGQTCIVEVVFKPTATGLRTGTITITDNAVNGPQVIQLSGTGD